MAFETLFWLFLAALALAVGATLGLRRLALRTHLVARPTPQAPDAAPVPLLGGVALYLACAGSLLWFGGRWPLPELAGFLGGATLMTLLGLWDDRRPLPPLHKLAGQALITAVPVLSGIHVQLFPAPLLNILLTFAWILLVTNALNLLDNMDGLAAGVAAIAAAFFLVFALSHGPPRVAGVAAALMGACLGFLFFNFHPARLYMGDAGSLFLGYVLAVLGLALHFPGRPAGATWLIPVLVLGVPLFDTAYVTVRRLRRGVAPWQGGTDHLSHCLTARGWSTRRAVAALYLAGLVAGLGALAVSLLAPLPAGLLAGTLGLLACLAARRLCPAPAL